MAASMHATDGRTKHSPIAIALCAALALAVAIGFGRFGFTAIYPLMDREGILGIKVEAIAQTLHFFGYFAGAMMVIRVPRQATIYACIGGLAANILLLAMTSLTNASDWIYADRFLSGVASAVVMVMVSTWLFQMVGTRYAPLLYGGAGVGVVVAGETVAALAARDVPSHSVWLVLAAVATVLALPPLAAMKSSQVSADQVGPAISVRPDIDPLRLVVVYAAGGFGYVVSATYLPALVARATGSLDPIHVFSLFGLCVVPSCAIWTYIDKTIGTRRALVANYLVQIIGTALPIVSSHPIALLAVAVAIGSTFMGAVAIAMAAGRRHGSTTGYNLMAVLTAAYALGQAAGPAAMAFLSRTAEDLNRPLGLSICVLGAAIVVALIPRPARSPNVFRRLLGHHNQAINASMRWARSL